GTAWPAGPIGWTACLGSAWTRSHTAGESGTSPSSSTTTADGWCGPSRAATRPRWIASPTSWASGAAADHPRVGGYGVLVSRVDPTPPGPRRLLYRQLPRGQAGHPRPGSRPPRGVEPGPPRRRPQRRAVDQTLPLGAFEKP